MSSTILKDFLAMPSSPYLIAAAAVFLALLYYAIKRRNLLPGPTGLPFFGLWPYLTDDKSHIQLEEIGKKYGDIFSFTFVGNLFINLGSPKAIREVHVQKSDCFERFTDFNVVTYMQVGGVAMTNGDLWKTLRKFFVQGFKDYAMPSMKHTMDGPIYDSLTKLIEELRSSKGKPINVIDPLTIRCTSTMRNALFGNSGSKDDEIIAMLKAFTIVLDGMTGLQMLLIGPFVRNVFYRLLPKYRAVLAAHDNELAPILYKVVRRIEANFDESNPTCIVESYYKERNERRRKNDPSAKHFTETSLVSSLAQLVGDGIFTVALFIGCFLHALIEHPEEQDKIYEEIANVIGTERLPILEDKSRMPRTNAFMLEVARTINFFALFPSLVCIKETTLRGYRIPKGAITLLNIWSSNHDPGTYENPKKFDPSRYIPAPGKQRDELPVNFGIGKRGCMGEAFVMLQSFLFLTTIVQSFQISEPKNSSKKSSMFLMTGELELCFLPRSDK